MLERLIGWSAVNKMVVTLLFAAVAGWGAWAVLHTPLDAIPDLSDNQVIVYTDWPGRGPQIVEDQVTYPLATNLQGLPRVRAVRASSAFGYSMIYVIFEDDVDIYWARTRVLERLGAAQTLLPMDVVPTLGPDGTGVGHVFWYTVEGQGYDLGQLRSVQDWYLRYQLQSVPGVAEVASVGGFVREYQVDVDPVRLFNQRLTLTQVIEAVRKSNVDVGGRLLEANDMEYIVRGLGYIRSVQDLENTVVAADERGVPIHLRDVAVVQLGGGLRRGLLDKDGRGEVVGGIVVMRYGENAQAVIDRVQAKILELAKGLPPGVRIVPAYDRSDLIHRAVETLKHTLVEEAIVVSLVILVFLWHVRSALVVIATIPLAVLIAFVSMYYLGITSNIMSLGGIAIAIGVLVDAGVVMVENAYRHLAEAQQEAKGEIEPRQRFALVVEAARQVGRPIFFSLVIIVLSFTPVFLLEGQEGKLFRPLAFTKTFAMAAATVLSVTLIPALMVLLMRGRMRPEEQNPLSLFFIALYRPALAWAMRWKKTVVLLTLVSLAGAALVATRIGSEFMPELDEGSLLFMPTMLPNVTISEAKRLTQVQDRIIKQMPEVESVLGKVGRAETATDPAPVSMIETIVNLKPREQWRPGITKRDIVAELDQKLKIPGVANAWTQPIINRINMLATGVRTELGVKLLGKDLKTVEELAQRVETLLQDVPGAVDLYAERVTAGTYLDIRLRREALARHGLAVRDVQDVIETALGGQSLTTTVEGRERYPVRVRYLRELRDSPEALRRVLVPTMAGQQIPLAQLADIRIVAGPPMISSENGLLQAIVYLNVRGRDVGSFVTDAKRVLDARLDLPAGYYLKWSGQYEHQERAARRLQFLVPAVFLLILILLYFTYHAWGEALLVMASVPFALVGGVLLLWLLGYNFSVAVWVGFIALFGVAVETAVVMMIYLQEALARHQAAGPLGPGQIEAAAMEGAVLRLRPKLMTVSVALLGLVPIMWSTGTGSDVMKPIAAPMIGGMITSTILVLIVIPVLFVLLKDWQRRRGTLEPLSFLPAAASEAGLVAGQVQLSEAVERHPGGEQGASP